MNLQTFFEAQIVIVGLVTTVAGAAALWAVYAPLPPQSDGPGPVCSNPADHPDRKRIFDRTLQAIIFISWYFIFSVAIFLIIAMIVDVLFLNGLLSPSFVPWLFKLMRP